MTESKPEYSSQQLAELEQIVSEGIQQVLKLAIRGDGSKYVIVIIIYDIKYC